MVLDVIARGVAFAKAYIPETVDFNAETKNVKLEEVLASVIHEINEMLNQASDNQDILLFQLAILNDSALFSDIKTRLKQTNSLSQALNQAMGVYIGDLLKSNDPYLRARVVDIEDVKSRVIRKAHSVMGMVDENIILCVDELYPSLIFEYQSHIKAILALKGSNLSHGAILARERNIPFMIIDSFDFNSMDSILVDANNGLYHVNPNPDLVSVVMTEHEKEESDLSLKHYPNKLFINYSGIKELDPTYIRNCNGIGLYRSEFLYYELGRFPTVEEQVMIFDNLLRSFYPKPVVIRTYDFGEDKTPIGMHIETRGVASYILHLKDDFVNQVKALLISHSRYDNLRIMIPMVFQKDDLDVFKKILDGVQEDLKLTSEQPKVGVMIETKEAFNHLEDFATADFISIGTNDLGNSLFGYGRDHFVDRSRYVESLCEAIDVISIFAREKQIGCTICGDIASQKDGFLRLLKQGETNFSIAIPFLKEAKQLINQDK